MNPTHFLKVFILSLSLTSCGLFQTLSKNNYASVGSIEKKSLTKKDRDNRCIPTDYIFRDNVDDNLYGLECIEGAKILIKTKPEGELVTTATSAGESLRLEEEDQKGNIKEVESLPGLINKYYKIEYDVPNKGNNREQPKWLKALIPDNLDFYGAKETEYEIVFKTVGDHLVLYKAVKDLDKLPFIHRSALLRDESGSYKVDEQGYYKVPFIGYQVTYCNLKNEIDDTTGRPLRYMEPDCDELAKTDNPDFIRLDRNAKKTYKYAKKQNVFPVSYFLGSKWFYTMGAIETAKETGHSYTEGALFVELETKENELVWVDASDTLSRDQNRSRDTLFKVEWKEYERNCIDAVCEFSDDITKFDSFAERETETKDYDKRPYIKINFPERIEVADIIITENYFSIEYYLDTEDSQRVKAKLSLLRENKVNQSNFHQKRWFKEDQYKKFPILPAVASTEESVSSELEAQLEHIRQSRFNTSKKETLIKWHFSKDTVRNNQDGELGTADDRDGDFYRDLGRQAVETFNRAFEIITKEYCLSKGEEENCKSIKVKLEEDDKDLGDLRYNILNLVNAKVLENRRGLLGAAPSFVREDTGQIIGTTSNVFIHTILKLYRRDIEDYIRYEVFRNQKIPKIETQNSVSDNEEHVVSSYIREKIEDRCELDSFIDEKRALAQAKKLKPGDSLNDKVQTSLIENCSRKISREDVLGTIIHEMGHSFGLGHNFKASVDSENYYKDLGEAKRYFPEVSEISKSSSVMDYLPSDQKAMTVLGKYDLAVLRYLYLDQVERESYSYGDSDIESALLSLRTAKDPAMQSQLSDAKISQMKNYQACMDYLKSNIVIKEFGKDGSVYRAETRAHSVSAEDFLCIMHDYGSNPEEIVQNYIKSFKRSFNNRYRYAKSNPFMSFQPQILSFYNKWLDVRNKYLESQGAQNTKFVLFNDKEGIEKYKTSLVSGLEKGDSEYKLYYPVRELAAEFIMDLFLLESMKCKVKDERGEEFFLDLEDIKSKLVGDNLYVEDCLSQSIKEFLDENDLSLIAQQGVENFRYYSFKENPEQSDVAGRDHVLSNIDKMLAEINRLLTLGLGEHPNIKSNIEYDQKSYLFYDEFMKEPDFLKIFMNRLEKVMIGRSQDIKSDVFYSDLKHTADYIALVGSLIEELKPEDRSGKMTENSYSLTARFYQKGSSAIGSIGWIERLIKNEGVASASTVITDHPFLLSLYKDYANYQMNFSIDIPFQTYLLEHDDSKNYILDLSKYGTEALLIPVKKDSIFARIFLAYNSNDKRWKELSKKESLTALEQIERENLDKINERIFEFFRKLDEQELKKQLEKKNYKSLLF